MMISRKEFEILEAEIAKRSEARVETESGSTPASIVFLRERLAEVTDEADRKLLYTLMASAGSKASNSQLYLAILREKCEQFPLDPIAYIDLAFGIAQFDEHNKLESAKCAREAIVLAKNQKRLVKYSATYAARVALLLDDYELLDHALAELIRDSHTRHAEDTGLEFDFIDQIDARRLDGSILGEYLLLSGDVPRI